MNDAETRSMRNHQEVRSGARKHREVIALVESVGCDVRTEADLPSLNVASSTRWSSRACQSPALRAGTRRSATSLACAEPPRRARARASAQPQPRLRPPIPLRDHARTVRMPRRGCSRAGLWECGSESCIRPMGGIKSGDGEPRGDESTDVSIAMNTREEIAFEVQANSVTLCFTGCQRTTMPRRASDPRRSIADPSKSGPQ
jgi:hypothetical protein